LYGWSTDKSKLSVCSSKRSQMRMRSFSSKNFLSFSGGGGSLYVCCGGRASGVKPSCSSAGRKARLRHLKVGVHHLLQLLGRLLHLGGEEEAGGRHLSRESQLAADPPIGAPAHARAARHAGNRSTPAAVRRTRTSFVCKSGGRRRWRSRWSAAACAARQCMLSSALHADGAARDWVSGAAAHSRSFWPQACRNAQLVPRYSCSLKMAASRSCFTFGSRKPSDGESRISSVVKYHERFCCAAPPAPEAPAPFGVCIRPRSVQRLATPCGAAAARVALSRRGFPAASSASPDAIE
jgi:hypothetical protein